MTGKKIHCSNVMAFYLLKQELNPEMVLSKPSCIVGHLAYSQGRRFAWDKQVAASRTFLPIAEGSVANMMARNKLQLICWGTACDSWAEIWASLPSGEFCCLEFKNQISLAVYSFWDTHFNEWLKIVVLMSVIVYVNCVTHLSVVAGGSVWFLSHFIS